MLAGILFFIASCALIFADFKIYQKKQELKLQIDNYKKEIEAIKNRNKELSEGIKNSNEEHYIEKVAREELDMQKPGENVVAFIMPEQKAEEKKQENFMDIKIWAGWLSSWWREIFKSFK